MLLRAVSVAFMIPIAAVLAADTKPAAFSPKLVTLDLKDAALDKVIDELEKQSGAAFDRERMDASRRITIACSKLPFFEALEKIAKTADHRIAFTEAGRKIMLMGGDKISYREMPQSIDGPFRVCAKRVTAIYDLESDRSVYEVQMDLHWERGVALFLVDSPGKRVKAQDNADRELTLAEPGGRLPASGGGIHLSLRLSEVPRSTRTIKNIQGEFGVIGASGMQKYEFNKWDEKEQVSTQDGVSVKIRNDFKKGAELWTARVMIEYPADGPQLESFESSAWLADNEAYLMSADGKKKLEVNGGTEVISQSERRADINYRWVPQGNAPALGDPKDWKLVVKTPSKLVETTVKFKLENIPLP